MAVAHNSSLSWLTKTISKPGFWFILALLLLITLPHYGEAFKYPGFFLQMTSNLDLDRHAVERILYLAPVVWSGFMFGWRGAFITSMVALACMLPRAIFISESPKDALFESSAVFIIGNVLAISFHSLRREREHRIQLEIAQQEQQRVTEELKVMQQNLRFYLQQATQAQEEERKRISHELHDDTIQALIVLSRQLDALISNKDGVSEESRLRLEQLWEQTDNILKGVRRLSQDLRPAALDRLGLIPALEWLASNVAEYSGVATKINVVGEAHHLPEEVTIATFRIIQEALGNVWRHSGATSAEITVEFDKAKTRITVSDNGRGFNLPENVGDLAKNGKLGLTGMQERTQLVGGTLKIQSEVGRGSSITVELPA
ncbi:sensor histidine kinase [Chloroflexota bacterium]